jgi:hypothetical protein
MNFMRRNNNLKVASLKLQQILTEEWAGHTSMAVQGQIKIHKKS